METCEFDIVEQVVDAAKAVHEWMGAGDERCHYVGALCEELAARGLEVSESVWVPERYKGLVLVCGYSLDLVVENQVAVKVAGLNDDAAERARNLRAALQLCEFRQGVFVDFNEAVLEEGIERICQGVAECTPV